MAATRGASVVSHLAQRAERPARLRLTVAGFLVSEKKITQNFRRFASVKSGHPRINATCHSGRLLQLVPIFGLVCGLARTAKALVVRASFSRLKRSRKLTRARRSKRPKRPTTPKYPTWTDHAGRRWKVPAIKDRLSVHQIKGHAALKAHVICRDGGVCRQCGSADDLTLDHVVSKRNGGTHHPDNLQALCKPCNDAKSNYQDRGRVPTVCGQLSFQGLACARTAGHSGGHCAPGQTFLQSVQTRWPQ